jgi:hypothetical protein
VDDEELHAAYEEGLRLAQTELGVTIPGISERSNKLAALMTSGVGANRLKALGDVEQTADLIASSGDGQPVSPTL